MADIETKMISQSNRKQKKWKHYIDDIFSLWDGDIQQINLFIEHANNFHPTIKFTAEISENETTFLGMIIYKENDSEITPFYTSVLITSRLKLFSTLISPRATHQALKEVLLKGKPLDF